MGEKMLPREKLKQCFTCKNNLECFGLLENVPLGKNCHDFSINHLALKKFIDEYLGGDEVSIGEQYGIISAAFLKTLMSDGVATRKDIYQLICVLCALCNTSDDTWICSGEDPGDEKTFVYEAV